VLREKDRVLRTKLLPWIVTAGDIRSCRPAAGANVIGSRPQPAGEDQMARRFDGRAAPARGRGTGLIGTALGLGALAYAGFAALAWRRYGQPTPPRPNSPAAGLLDRFMPRFDVAEQHEIEVNAPAATTFAAARALDINASPVVRAIFAARTLPARLRGEPVSPRQPRSLVDEAVAIGWRVLAEVPDRALVMGAVTQPWQATPVFRGLDPDEFAAFAAPGYVKIVWTLEAEPLGESRSRFRTETRADATDPSARDRFRRYWALVSPGILLIRRMSLGLVKAEAERRARASGSAPTPSAAQVRPPAREEALP
jgi:hypothetical protein